MTQGWIARTWTGWRPTVVTAGCLLAETVIGLLTVLHGGIRDFAPLGIATASRTLSAILTVTMTSIALILPLTANLYTPRVVKLYVAHPLIVGGLSVFIMGNLLHTN
jgi:hypothetical protein